MRHPNLSFAIVTMVTGITGALMVAVRKAMEREGDDVARAEVEAAAPFQARRPGGHFLIGSISDAFGFPTPLGYLSAAAPPYMKFLHSSAA
jgi:hypothetical protein